MPDQSVIALQLQLLTRADAAATADVSVTLRQDTCLQNKLVPAIFRKQLNGSLVSDDELKHLWGSRDDRLHNHKHGIPVRLGKLQAVYEAVHAAPAAAPAGRFTAGGAATVGEVKLWATLHMLVLVQPALLDSFVGLGAFYHHLAADAAVQRVVETGGQFPAKLQTYFVARGVEAAAGKWP